MEQHPIPQNVTAYQFRLVGDMTLKQFLELAGGVVLAFLTTRFTLIPVFLRWPLAGIFTFTGIALAFLPLEERPLDQWLVNFIKSIYSPTQFLWKKQNLIPKFLTFVPGKTQAPLSKTPPKNQKELQSFLQTIQSSSKIDPVDQQELSSLNYINKLLGVTSSPQAIQSPPTQPNIAASPGIKTRRLRTPEQIKKEVVVFKQTASQQKTSPQPLSPNQLTPKTKQVSVKPIVQIIPPTSPPLVVTSLPSFSPKPKNKDKPRVAPVYDQDLPLPSPPEAPNLLVGMIVTVEGNLLPNAIVEIKNNKGQTVRAVKTNKLGQFFTATPLLNGDYELKTEHPKYSFDIIKFKAEGKIIPPIKIKTKAQKKLETGTN